MEKMSLIKLFKLYIANTEEKQPVIEMTIFICNLTNAVMNACGLTTRKIHVNTKILKHLYDRKPAEEFDFILRNLHTIVKYPDNIYRNKDSKKGDFCFVKNLKGQKYLSSIQVNKAIKTDGNLELISYIVTCFRVRDDKYLKNYELLWSWKGGNPSS